MLSIVTSMDSSNSHGLMFNFFLKKMVHKQVTWKGVGEKKNKFYRILKGEPMWHPPFSIRALIKSSREMSHSRFQE